VLFKGLKNPENGLPYLKQVQSMKKYCEDYLALDYYVSTNSSIHLPNRLQSENICLHGKSGHKNEKLQRVTFYFFQMELLPRNF
jgi:hypothetical protein